MKMKLYHYQWYKVLYYWVCAVLILYYVISYQLPFCANRKLLPDKVIRGI